MKNIAIVGAGYVGLVTGTAFAHIGNRVTCIDIDADKIKLLSEGISPIFEPGLEEMLKENLSKGKLSFTTSMKEGVESAEIIFLTVGTPPMSDGSADLSFIFNAASEVGKHLARDSIVVTKSTVPVGTNERIKEILEDHKSKNIRIDVVSNPEFLREGSAIHDTFHGDRIVIGSENPRAAHVIEELYSPFQIPIMKTDTRSAELIKYASNAFLATKISFINEMAILCEKLGANIDEVSSGMGMDQRIGNQFLQAGAGYGGSCFPKDTRALIRIAENVNHHIPLLEFVININNRQQEYLVKKALERFGSLKGKSAAILGLSFKPNTDDVRESPAIKICQSLIEQGAYVTAFDPIAMEKAKAYLPKETKYACSIEECLQDADLAFIVTDWNVFKEMTAETFIKCMKHPIVFDGRNCFSLEAMRQYEVDYYSIGRPILQNWSTKNGK
ncbi:UDP-glucose dehydrogenase family protein [Peribacillus tepidiphilus]|uniref:UDP-glucose dehydrogenase family protein n=1 Tax=Peribacillus tepidiphilus TaxID=2652445 RepID=UPI0012923896|nr:UDP-glucose/GDP-mannose dehydrogenase family protein [Peribacillus tepidiphilus]